jgi:hypothetical protein
LISLPIESLPTAGLEGVAALAHDLYANSQPTGTSKLATRLQYGDLAVLGQLVETTRKERASNTPWMRCVVGSK